MNGYAHSKLLGNGSDIGIQNAATNYELRQCNVIVSRKKYPAVKISKSSVVLVSFKC